MDKMLRQGLHDDARRGGYEGGSDSLEEAT
jgi:hypothetical protein